MKLIFSVFAFFVILEGSAKPNIILIMSDDQGYNGLSAYGNTRIQTPHLDEIGENGVTLKNFYAAHPNCSPTRVSVLTGRHPHRMNSTHAGWPIRSQEVTLPEILKENGYTTAHFGKWHIGSMHPDAPTAPRNNGFDVWYAERNYYENSPIFLNDTGLVQLTGEGSEVTADLTIQFIEDAVQKEQPFFTTVWFGSPHDQWESYEPADLAAVTGGTTSARKYHAEIIAMDRAIGKIMDVLDSLEIENNTIVWYKSDNGPRDIDDNQAHPLAGKKNQLKEGGIRVPSVIQWPDSIPKNQVSTFNSNTVDILPTILDAANIPMKSPPPLDGINILPHLKGKEQTRTKPMKFWMMDGATVISTWGFSFPGYTQSQKNALLASIASVKNKEQNGEEIVIPDSDIDVNITANKVKEQAIIDGDFKLYCTGTNDCQLYNLKLDIGESNNIASTNAAKVTSMKNQLNSWRNSVVNSTNGNDFTNFYGTGCKDPKYKEYAAFATTSDSTKCKELATPATSSTVIVHTTWNLLDASSQLLSLYSPLSQEVRMTLFSVSGHAVLEKQFTLLQGKNSVTLPYLNGVYLLKVENIQTRKTSLQKIFL